MDSRSPLTPLVQELNRLPGIGPKSAERLAFFFLSLPKSDVGRFSRVLTDTRESIRYCDTCFNISLSNQCFVCASPGRERNKLCVVADPKALLAIERTSAYKGIYHILGGLISPIDGIHPEALRIQELLIRIKDGTFDELILAFNPTIEGDATALYLQQLLAPTGLKLTKLAYGLPVGADIDYADELTLEKALAGRVGL